MGGALVFRWKNHRVLTKLDGISRMAFASRSRHHHRRRLLLGNILLQCPQRTRLVGLPLPLFPSWPTETLVLYYYTNMRANHLLCTKVPIHCLVTPLAILGVVFLGHNIVAQETWKGCQSPQHKWPSRYS